MTKFLAAACCAATVVLTLVPASGQSPAPSRKIEVLFLGHKSQHHPSSKYAPMLKEALAAEPFTFSYTDDPKDLNDANLAKYDTLIIYANHSKIEPDQEKALLGFVAGGKGFVPLHCASFCFQNSPDYIALVGAQFKRHRTGEFTTEIVKPDHPTLDGIKPFHVWDETYVHDKHNPDRTVLMERVDDEGREPWTWVRTHGKGRIFYTAYGHDDRVWSHPSFQRLVTNALKWAAGPNVRAQAERRANPALQHVLALVP